MLVCSESVFGIGPSGVILVFPLVPPTGRMPLGVPLMGGLIDDMMLGWTILVGSRNHVLHIG